MASTMRLLTDNAAVRQRRIELVSERRKMRKKQTLHSDATKIEVVKTYLALGGNLTLTAGAVAISRETLKDWKATTWWSNLITELKKEDRLEFSASAKRIIESSMPQILDRVENGDYMYNQKTGQLVRKPVAAKDLLRITVDLMAQKEILDKSTENNAAPESHDDKLKALAERFIKLAEQGLKDKQKPLPDVVEVEATEVPDAKEKS